MGDHHLKSRKTGDSHITLVTMDQKRTSVVETRDPADLEEVIERFLDQYRNTRRRPRQARDYRPVLEIIQSLSRSLPCLRHENFPTDWTDPLDLYGCLAQELARRRADLDSERRKLAGFIFDNGPEWVWKNRLRLVAETLAFFRFSGDPAPPPPEDRVCNLLDDDS